MKKLSILAGCAAMACASFAATPLNVFFSSKGPDKYADGSLVEDGEVYAFVWTADGAEFAGFNYDGTLVDPVNNKVIRMYAVAKDGGCPLCAFPLDDGDQDLAGSFAVYMLDTRVVAQDGTVTVAAKTEDGLYESLSGYEKVDADIVKTAVNAPAAAVSGEGAVASALPADVKQPVITGITVNDGEVLVSVENTVPYVRYAISAGETPKADDKVIADGVNGVEGGEIVLRVSNPEKNRFFKVVRSK